MIRVISTFLAVAVTIAAGAACHAQPTTARDVDPGAEQPTSAESQIGSDRLEKLRADVESVQDVDDEQKQKLLETVQKAAAAVTRAEKLESQAPVDQVAISEVAVRAKELQAELAASPPGLLLEIPDNASLADLTAALATRQPKLQERREALTALEAEPARRMTRRTEIVGDQASYAKRRADIEKELKATAPPDESALATSVRQALLLARLREVIAEGPAMQAELSRYDAAKAADLPTLKIRLARQELTRLGQEIERLNERITQKRNNDARFIAEQLRSFASATPTNSPYVEGDHDEELFAGTLTVDSELAMATETAQLATENVEATTKLARATTELADAQAKLINLGTLKSRTQERIDRVGLTGAIGLELRHQLHILADADLIRQQCQARQDEMHDLEFKRLELEDEAIAVASTLTQLRARDVSSEAKQIQLRLTHDRHAALTAIGKSYGEYFNRLGEIDVTEQERIREVDEFRASIRKLVLWIRSNRWPGMEDARELVTTAQWFLSPSHWNQVASTLWEDVRQHLWLYALITLLTFLLFGIQPRFRRNLTRVGEIARRPACLDFHPTARASVLTLVIAVAWPVLPAFFGWRLVSDATTSPFALAVGFGLLKVAAASLTLSLLRTLCRASGLGIAHFNWPAHTVKTLRSRIQTLMFVLLPLLFVEATLHADEKPQGRDALERLVFVVSVLVLAQFLVRITHPRTGIFRDLLKRSETAWAFRLRWVFYAAMVALPLFLAALAIAGFYYTAYELSWRLHVTIWVLIALLVLRSYLIRWFVISHRRLRMEEARQRRQAMLEEQNSDVETPTVLKAIDTTNVDLKAVSDQTRRFIDSGLALVCLAAMWFVWVNVLPALGILDSWELWPTMVETTVEYTDTEGVKRLRTEPRLESVTAADGLIALLLLLVTATAARNVPGLLEITLLRRLPMEPSIRYAISMVARYLILVLGVIAAAAAIGVGWSQVQWLAAALTVGLGFGLQEIFANFVSGLIILMERPVRIGDVVTIGDVTGTVSRIQIRATTITDWDCKEYIVPNKEFVTGRLLNWTLTNSTNRVVLKIGVAYGSKTEEARELLLKVARENTNILDDPPPVASFEGFGDSTLDLVLRAYLPNLDNRLNTITALHEAVDREFAAAGIEISFPQRDVHVRSMPDLRRD